jgi:4-aminobutyrate aminotransferase-like enzyme
MDRTELNSLANALHGFNRRSKAAGDMPTSSLGRSLGHSQIIVTGGYGAEIQTSQGSVFDLCSMTQNCCLGQNDPWVTAHLLSYISSGRPSFVSSRFHTELSSQFADRIVEAFPISDGIVNHRQCNGTDATELSLIAAWNARGNGRDRLISFRGSYHGQGLTAFIASDIQQRHRFLYEPACVHFLQRPPAWDRTFPDEAQPEAESEIFDKLETIIDEAFAVIIEPIQVNHDVSAASPRFLAQLAAACQRHKVALIFDEVQTAFGWLGVLSAAEFFEVTPDIIAVGKALTAGYGPLAAMLCRPAFNNLQYGTSEKTNGGDARSLVAAMAVLDRLEGLPLAMIPNTAPEWLAAELSTGLLCKVPHLSDLLFQHCRTLVEAFPKPLAAVTGLGLIAGIRCRSTRARTSEHVAQDIVGAALKKGVLLRSSGGVVQFKPPLTIDPSQLSQAFERLHDLLSDDRASLC